MCRVGEVGLTAGESRVSPTGHPAKQDTFKIAAVAVGALIDDEFNRAEYDYASASRSTLIEHPRRQAMAARMRRSEDELRDGLQDTLRQARPELPDRDVERLVDSFLHFNETFEDPGLVWRTRQTQEYAAERRRH